MGVELVEEGASDGVMLVFLFMGVLDFEEGVWFCRGLWIGVR